MNCEPTNFASRLSTNAPVLPTSDQPEPEPPWSLRNHSIAGESIASDELARRIEEVERVRGRRRVDDDQVPLRRSRSKSWSLAIAAYSCAPASEPEICA